MGFINLAEKTVNAKLVYYGVGLGGKTTSLKVVHGLMCPRDEVKLVSINTEQDSTLLFDFLPIDLGQVEGFKIRVRGFTVPGQIQYVAMRKYVLSGADAVVLVVDSQRSKIEDNLQSIEDLKTNLVANGLDWQSIPLVIQYNKRDLPDVVPEDELDKHFLFREARCFQTIATEGKGVFETFMEAVSMMVEEKVGHYGLGKGSVTPKDVASEARQRLAGFLPGKEDAGARSGSAVEESGLVSLTVPHDVTVPIGAEEAAPSSKGRKQATARGAEGSRRKKKKKGKKAAGKRPSAPAKGKGPRRESAEGELSDADLSELFTDQDIA
ncbi:MAG: ATP/GTP-binding protein, partial [Planctomycetota bacterium]